MASSKLLKERIESIQDTRKITNAMYLISSSKLRKARKNYQNVLPYFTRMRDTISRVVPHLPDEPVHPFFHERQREDGDPRRAYLVLTADKGMAGSFNQNVLKLLLERLTGTTVSMSSVRWATAPSAKTPAWCGSSSTARLPRRCSAPVTSRWMPSTTSSRANWMRSI